MTKERQLRETLSIETQADKAEYNRRRATAKRAVRQNRHVTWNNFVTKPEHDIMT
jgi:hypothetical protein